MIPSRDNPSPRTMALRYATLSILTSYLLIWLIVFFSEQGIVTSYTGISLMDFEKERTYEALSLIRNKEFVIVGKVDSGSVSERAGVHVGDTIVTVDGIQLKDKPQLLYKLCTESPYGDTLNIGLIKNGTQENRVLVLDKKKDIFSFLVENIFPVLSQILCLVVGGLIGWMRIRDSIAFLCSVFFFCAWFVEGVYYPWLPYWANVMAITYNSIPNAMVFPLGLRLFSIFPNPSRFGKVVWRWQWVAFVLFSLDAFISYAKYLSILLEWSIIIPLTQQVAQMFEPVGVALFVAFILLIIQLYLSQRKETRDRPQARLKIIEFSMLFWGLSALAGVVFVLIWSMLPEGLLKGIPPSILIVFVIIFISPFFISTLAVPISFAYTILTRKIFDIRFIIRKGLRYLLLSKGALIVEGIIVFLIVIQILSYAGTEFLNSPTAVGGVAVASTLAVIAVVGRVNRKLMPVIDRQFFREALDVKKLLMDLNEQLSELRERDKILQLTASTVLKALHPARVMMLLKHGKSDEFRCELTIEDKRVKLTQPEQSSPTRHAELVSASIQSNVQIPNRVRDDAGGGFVLKAEDSIIKQMEEKKSYVTIYPEKLDPEVEGDKRLLDLNCELFIAIQGSAGLVGIMALGGKLSEEPFSKEDRDLLSTVARQMGLSLENAELLEVAKREAEQSRDLEIARSVQQNLFPKQLPVVAGWEFAGICKPAKAVGGDYYDIFEAVLGKVVVALGDVSGKGLGASFVMSGVHSTIRTQAKKSFDNPVEMINELNEYLLGSTSKNIFVTLFLGIIDLKTGLMKYVNCGHPPAFVVRKENGEIEKLTRTGLALGMMSTVPFTQGSSILKAGDSLIVYSDGITEAMNSKEEMYEEERLTQLLTTTLGSDTSHMMNAILKSVSEFIGQAEQSDDVSIIVARRILETA